MKSPLELQRIELQRILEQCPAAYLVLAPDAAFTILAVTDAYLRLTLRRRAVLLGQGLFEAFPDNPEDAQASGARNLRASLQRVLATRAPDAMPVQRYDIPRPEGGFEERHWSPRNTPVLSEDGRVLYLLHEVEDVTHLIHLAQQGEADRAELRALRQAEAAAQELRRKDEQLRRVLDANEVGTWDLAPTTGAVDADARLHALFGLGEDARHVDAYFARVHPDDLPQLRAAIQAAVGGEDGGRFLVEFRVLRPGDTHARWVEARGQAYFTPGGHAERFFGTVLDVTERKRAELAREGLLEALGAQPVVFMALLRGFQLVFERVNPLYASLFRGQELLGRPLLEAVPELQGQGLDEAMRQAMATGEPFVARERVVPLLRGNPGVLEDAVFTFAYQPVRGADGAYDGVLIAGVEVTEEVRVRREAQARLAFEERLTGIVGHDLRSPLAALRLSTTQLSPGGQYAAGLSEGQARAVERVARAGRRIQGVISTLLDLTRARGERGFPVQPADADLATTVRAVIEELRETHPGREVHATHAGDTRGCFDPERLAQVAANLLENALKYGAPGAPVSLHCEGAGDTLRLVVHNAGAPIPPELQARLFHPFVQGPQSQDTVKLSLGLGLFIVREVVRAHGGIVTLESSAEAGTHVTVELPRHGPPGDASAPR